jgi:hypothetical protein
MSHASVAAMLLLSSSLPLPFSSTPHRLLAASLDFESMAYTCMCMHNMNECTTCCAGKTDSRRDTGQYAPERLPVCNLPVVLLECAAAGMGAWMLSG